MSKFNKGDICYTLDGREVEYIASLGTGYAVREIGEGDEGQQYFGNVIEVREVFQNPPQEKYNKEIDELKKQIDTLRAAKRQFEDERRASQESEKERKDRLMKHAALTRIDDFLAGKMTHLAMQDWRGWRVMSLKDALAYKESDYDRVPTGIKLVTLFGKTNGDLQWQLHAYKDGGTNPNKVEFFFSEEEARKFVKGRLDIAYDLYRKDNKEWRNAESAAQNAFSIGFEVPEDIEAIVKTITISSLTAARNKAKSDYELAEEKLAIGYVPREGKK